MLTIITASDCNGQHTWNDIALCLNDITQNESKCQLVFSMTRDNAAEELNGGSFNFQLLFTADHLYHTHTQLTVCYILFLLQLSL